MLHCVKLEASFLVDMASSWGGVPWAPNDLTGVAVVLGCWFRGSSVRARRYGRVACQFVKMAELTREKLYISWPLNRAVGERALTRDFIIVSYMSEFATRVTNPLFA